MTQAALIADLDAAPTPAASRARVAVLKRLADVVCLPSSRVNTFERSMTADLLVDILREASVQDRARVARRLSGLTDIPHPLGRMLLNDEVEVARELLNESPHLRDDDLLDCIHAGTLEHRRMIAARKGLSEILTDALASHNEAPVLEMLLRNLDARLGHNALEHVLSASQDQPVLTALLLKRPELRPAHAYAAFWWADADARLMILQRFAVSREVLQDAVSDVFSLAADEKWQDAPARKALQFIERRQRNRAALDKSPFDSLEEAVAAAADGLSREGADEISYLSGLKPTTGAKIFNDPGGEPLAILCKATGLPRGGVVALWRGLKREESADGRLAGGLRRVLMIYDMLAVDRAQTVLRYWNWTLSASVTPQVLQAIRNGEEEPIEPFSTSQRAAMLAISNEIGR